MIDAKLTPPWAARFWAKVNKDGPNGCWIWTAYRNQGGYGTFHTRDPEVKTRFAHRIAFLLVRGYLPEFTYTGPELDHLCRVHPCCNPDHLEVVPHVVNMRRGETVNAKHAAKTHCPKGHPYDRAGKNPQRYCSTCKKEHRARYVAKFGGDAAYARWYRRQNKDRINAARRSARKGS